MIIRCPECEFSRTIDISLIPATATQASCPKCGHKFRFRNPETGEFIPEVARSSEFTEENISTEAGTPASSIPDSSIGADPASLKDVPLPPGAVIPHFGSDRKKSDDNSGNPLKESFGEGAEDSLSEASERSAEDPFAESSENSTGNSAENSSANFNAEKETHRSERPFREPSDSKDSGASADARADSRADSSRRRVHSPESERQNRAGLFARMLGRAGTDAILPGDVPWEHPEQYGIFGSVYHTIMRVLFRAPEFFSNIHGTSSLLRPAFFYALLGLFQTIMAHLWSLNTLRSLSETTSDPQALAMIENLMQGFSTPLIIILTPFLMIFQLVLFSLFFHLMVRLAQPEKADFGTIMRVISYSSAPTVLAVVPFIGIPVGVIWFAVNTFIGTKYALKLSWVNTTLALAPLFIMWLAFSFFQAQAMLGSLV